MPASGDALTDERRSPSARRRIARARERERRAWWRHEWIFRPYEVWRGPRLRRVPRPDLECAVALFGSSKDSSDNSKPTVDLADPGLAGAYLLVELCADDPTTSFTAPDGTWSRIFNTQLTGGDSQKVEIWRKKSATGSGSYAFTNGNGSEHQCGLLLAISGADNTIEPNFTKAQIDDTNQADPWTITAPSDSTGTTVANCGLIAFLAIDPNGNTGTDSWTTPSGYGTIQSNSPDSSGWCGAAAAFKLLGAAGPISAAAATDTRGGSLSACRVGYHIALAPAAGGGGVLALPDAPLMRVQAMPSYRLQQPWEMQPKTATRTFFEAERDLRQPRSQLPETVKSFKAAQQPAWDGQPKTATRSWLDDAIPLVRQHQPNENIPDDFSTTVPPPPSTAASAAPWCAPPPIVFRASGPRAETSPPVTTAASSAPIASATAPPPVARTARVGDPWWLAPLTGMRSWLDAVQPSGLSVPPPETPAPPARPAVDPWFGSPIAFRSWLEASQLNEIRAPSPGVPAPPARPPADAWFGAALSSLRSWFDGAQGAGISAPPAAVPVPPSRPAEPWLQRVFIRPWFDAVQASGVSAPPASVPSPNQRPAAESWFGAQLAAYRSWFDQVQASGVSAAPPPIAPPRRPADDPWWKGPIKALATWLEDAIARAVPVRARQVDEPFALATKAASSFVEWAPPAPAPVAPRPPANPEAWRDRPLTGMRAWHEALLQLPLLAPRPPLPEIWSLKTPTFAPSKWWEWVGTPPQPGPTPFRQPPELWTGRPITPISWAQWEASSARPRPTAPIATEIWSLKTPAVQTSAWWPWDPSPRAPAAKAARPEEPWFQARGPIVGAGAMPWTSPDPRSPVVTPVPRLFELFVAPPIAFPGSPWADSAPVRIFARPLPFTPAELVASARTQSSAPWADGTPRLVGLPMARAFESLVLGGGRAPPLEDMPLMARGARPPRAPIDPWTPVVVPVRPIDGAANPPRPIVPGRPPIWEPWAAPPIATVRLLPWGFHAEEAPVPHWVQALGRVAFDSWIRFGDQAFIVVPAWMIWEMGDEPPESLIDDATLEALIDG